MGRRPRKESGWEDGLGEGLKRKYINDEETGQEKTVQCVRGVTCVIGMEGKGLTSRGLGFRDEIR